MSVESKSEISPASKAVTSVALIECSEDKKAEHKQNEAKHLNNRFKLLHAAPLCVILVGYKF